MFDPTRYHPSSELHRIAELAHSNEARILRWRARFTLATGREPVEINTPILTPWHAAVIRGGLSTNSNVVKFSSRKRQFKTGLLPDPPEAA